MAVSAVFHVCCPREGGILWDRGHREKEFGSKVHSEKEQKVGSPYFIFPIPSFVLYHICFPTQEGTKRVSHAYVYFRLNFYFIFLAFSLAAVVSSDLRPSLRTIQDPRDLKWLKLTRTQLPPPVERYTPKLLLRHTAARNRPLVYIRRNPPSTYLTPDSCVYLWSLTRLPSPLPQVYSILRPDKGKKQKSYDFLFCLCSFQYTTSFPSQPYSTPPKPKHLQRGEQTTQRCSS